MKKGNRVPDHLKGQLGKLAISPEWSNPKPRGPESSHHGKPVSELEATACNLREFLKRNSSISQMNSKWILDLITKLKTMKLLDKILGTNICVLGQRSLR